MKQRGEVDHGDRAVELGTEGDGRGGALCTKRVCLPEAALAAGTGAFAGVTECADLKAAVKAGFDWAKPDGLVLLSPAAPSFGVFRDYRDRGEAFAREVRALP